jgi:hypothetical protein
MLEACGPDRSHSNYHKKDNSYAEVSSQSSVQTLVRQLVPVGNDAVLSCNVMVTVWGRCRVPNWLPAVPLLPLRASLVQSCSPLLLYIQRLAS